MRYLSARCSPSRPLGLFRFQAGLLLLSLPRRFIPGGLSDLPPSGADQSLPNPRGDADSRQLGRLSDQLLLLGEESDAEGGCLGLVFCFAGLAMLKSVGQITAQRKREEIRLPFPLHVGLFGLQ